MRERGYDQAKLLARKLAREARLPYADCLARSGQAHQVGSNRSQRLSQLSDAFRITKPRTVQNAYILLVDDVLTTGATLEAAAKVLHATGASSVDAVVFARTPIKTTKS